MVSIRLQSGSTDLTVPTQLSIEKAVVAVYSKEVNKTSSYFNFGDATVDVLSARSGAQRFAPTVPYGAGAQGNNSLSCYYYTTGDGELYVRVNGTERHLDGPDDVNGRITFMAPLLDHFSNENRTFLFYLQEGQADDGSDCYRLKSVARQLGQSDASFTIRDYDVCLSAEKFQIVTVNDGPPMASPICIGLKACFPALIMPPRRAITGCGPCGLTGPPIP